MNDVRLRWSVWPWTRYTDDDPDGTESEMAALAAKLDGLPDEQKVMVTAGQLRALGVGAQHRGAPGAAITDGKRQVTYRATVDTHGQIDHLEIELTGEVNDARLARLRSIPREHIEATVAAFVKDQQPDTVQFVPEGGLLADELRGTNGQIKGGPALYAEVARLLAEGKGRQDIAVIFDRPVRTVDGWIIRARDQHQNLARRPATGRGYRAAKNPKVREEARRSLEELGIPLTPNEFTT